MIQMNEQSFHCNQDYIWNEKEKYPLNSHLKCMNLCKTYSYFPIAFASVIFPAVRWPAIKDVRHAAPARMEASVRAKESAPALLDGQYVFNFILNFSVLLNIKTKDDKKTVIHCIIQQFRLHSHIFLFSIFSKRQPNGRVPCFHSDRSSLAPVSLLYHTLVCVSPGVLVIYLNILVCKFVCVSQTDMQIFHQWANKWDCIMKFFFESGRQKENSVSEQNLLLCDYLALLTLWFSWLNSAGGSLHRAMFRRTFWTKLYRRMCLSQ